MMNSLTAKRGGMSRAASLFDSLPVPFCSHTLYDLPDRQGACPRLMDSWSGRQAEFFSATPSKVWPITSIESELRDDNFRTFRRNPLLSPNRRVVSSFLQKCMTFSCKCAIISRRT